MIDTNLILQNVGTFADSHKILIGIGSALLCLALPNKVLFMPFKMLGRTVATLWKLLLSISERIGGNALKEKIDKIEDEARAGFIEGYNDINESAKNDKISK